MRIDKRFILLNIPYLLFFWIADKICYIYRITEGNKIIALVQGIAEFYKAPLFSFHIIDISIGVIAALLIKCAVYVRGKNAKKYRNGIEYGSARWGTASDIAPYIDGQNFYNNVLLTNTERLTMDSRPKLPKYARNKNVLVIGGSGSGKTRFFIKPNLMQMHSSYVVTDPKGTVLIECGKLLQKGGYIIKTFNTINFKKSMKYNPFEYIRSEKDILKLVNTLIANTKGEGEKSSEDFWVKAERLYYCALIGYIWYVNNSKKQIHRGKTVTTFAFGSQRIYDYIDDNPAVEILPVEYVNDPDVICQNDNMISINAAVEVDLFGQVCAESVGTKHMSGSGGQIDYVRGTCQSRGGKSFIAFTSTAKGGTISKIKPILTPGAVVTTSKNDVDYIVTEYGVAHLRGRSLGERARQLIAIAHPDFRDELTFEAKKRGIMI